MNRAEKLKAVFSSPKSALVFAVTALAFGAVLAVTSDIVLFPAIEFNPLAQPAQVVLVSLISVLLAANASVIFFNSQNKKISSGKTTMFGAATALFTTACPVCQPVWLLWLGLGSTTAFLADISIFFATASVLLLIFSLMTLLKDESCEVGKIGKEI